MKPSLMIRWCAVSTLVLFHCGYIEEINVHVREQAVEFEMEDVTVILEWDELNLLYSVNVSVTPEAQVNISSSTARLTIAYNVMYNISVMISHLCGQNSVTIFTEVYYYLHSTTHSTKAIVATCDSLEGQLDDSVMISSIDPAVEGTTVTFYCLAGSISNGPVSSMCMENGEWEPAPYKVNCFGPGHGPFNGLTDDEKIALASILLTFVAGSIIFFIIGFVCRHFCRKERHNTQTSNGPGTASQCDQENILGSTLLYDDVVLKQREQELELKENVYLMVQ